ncbi:MAG TPA: hypothetical protein VFS67_27755 [Polyangiaceae bacterium]|nr:hypothetical protein [Polyangiaceae bacterium]
MTNIDDAKWTGARAERHGGLILVNQLDISTHLRGLRCVDLAFAFSEILLIGSERFPISLQLLRDDAEIAEDLPGRRGGIGPL